jgi:CubicO group peptidase (beta-lactamase class C family)
MIAFLLAGGIAGLWGSERIVSAGVRGEVTIERGVAHVSGSSAPVQIEGKELRFELPEGRGQLHAQAAGQGWRGHFIQPRALVGGAPFATPVELRRTGPQAWRGELRPLEQDFSLYFHIAPRPDGSLSAVVRNPELNVLRGRPLSVQVQGETVRFLDGAKERAVARFDAARDTLTLEGDLLDGGDPSVTLTRRGRDDAPGFWPRPSGAYLYRAPAPGEDGWSTASVGLDAKLLAALVEQIRDTDPKVSPLPAVQGILAARHGKLVLEEYFYGFSRDRLHDLRSAGKSFGTTLVGTAIDHGAAIDLQAPLESFFPEAPQTPEKRKITVEHALTMSTGLACDDDDDDSPGQEDRMQSQARDWYRYTLDLPVAHPAGSFAAYCSATMNLLGGVVRAATKARLTDLFDAQIAQPLGIARYALNLGPNSDMYFAGGLRLRPRDFLKLGQVFLDRGKWKGKRVVSESWVKAATSPHALLNNGSTDGYNWWLREIGGVRTYSAGGNGGQFLIVAPELDLVVAFTGGMYGNFAYAQKTTDELLTRYLFPAAKAAR